MVSAEEIFLNTNYTLYLNVVIGSILAVMSYLGVQRDLLFPFLSGWIVFFVITSTISNRLRYEEINHNLSRLNDEDPELVETLSSNREAYQYLTESLAWATEFKNTVYGTNPPELARHREAYVEKTYERLQDETFKMHEILGAREEHVAEARRKKEHSVDNYYCTFVDDEGCPLLPFSILEGNGRREALLGWYGEVLEPHSEDEYVVVREKNLVDMLNDHFESSFNLGQDQDLVPEIRSSAASMEENSSGRVPGDDPDKGDVAE